MFTTCKIIIDGCKTHKVNEETHECLSHALRAWVKNTKRDPKHPYGDGRFSSELKNTKDGTILTWSKNAVGQCVGGDMTIPIDDIQGVDFSTPEGVAKALFAHEMGMSL